MNSDALYALLAGALDRPDLRHGLEYLLGGFQQLDETVSYGLIVHNGYRGFLHVRAPDPASRSRIEQALLHHHQGWKQVPLRDYAWLAVPPASAGPLPQEGLELLQVSEQATLCLPSPVPALATHLPGLLRVLLTHDQSLQTVSNHDHLTGLHNRRYFEGMLARARQLHTRHQVPFALALLDIDGFKQINDIHGHPVGDRVLRKIGHSLRTALRLEDTCARIGGDEFALLLLHLDEAGSRQVTSRVLQQLNALTVSAPGGELPLKVSAGWVYVAADSPTPEEAELLSAADARLYAVKRGR